MHQLIIIDDVDDYKRRGESPTVSCHGPFINIEDCYTCIFDELNQEIKDYECDTKIPEEYKIQIEDSEYTNHEGNYIKQYRIDPKFKKDGGVLDKIWDIIMEGEFVPFKKTYEINKLEIPQSKETVPPLVSADSLAHECKNYTITRFRTKDRGRDYLTGTTSGIATECVMLFHWIEPCWDFSEIHVCMECGKVKGFDVKKTKDDLDELQNEIDEKFEDEDEDNN